MTAGWVAVSTRGGALLRRLVGLAGAHELAEAATWSQARSQLAATFYGMEMTTGCSRAEARSAATSATVWQLRVLAGWLPVQASGLARLFAGPTEIANIEGHLASLGGATTDAPVSLGSLAVAWPRVATTTSSEQVRAVLTHSAWGDPGGADPVAVAIGLRVAWARRLVRQVPETSAWAKGGLAVLIARESFAFGRDIAPVTGREIDRLVGKGWRQAATIPELALVLPTSAAWALADIASPADLWRAELAVTRRVTAEATQLAATKRPTKGTVAAVMALLLVDLWRVTAAVELAGRHPNPSEVLDAVA